MKDALIYTYKKSEPYKDLRLHVRKPKKSNFNSPAMIFFHGAGFTNNKVNASQFEHHANHFTSFGFVTICTEYRPLDIDGLFSPIECLKNTKSIFRWVRENSEALGIDPNKIIAVGASAGGYLCLCAAMIQEYNDSTDNLHINPEPNAMIIFNGGVSSDVLIKFFPDLNEQLLLASPNEAVREGLPPSLFFHGTDDKNISIKEVSNFTEKMRSKGNISRLITFEGLGHGFFNYGNFDNKPYDKTLADIEDFLSEIAMLGNSMHLFKTNT